MELTVNKVSQNQIQPLRALFLQETNFQIRYNACHERGWTDTYLLMVDDIQVGYGSIKGQKIAGRDTIFEFFVIKSFRKLSRVLFSRLIAGSGAKYIESQSNDRLLTSLLYEFGRNINADVVLFEDNIATEHVVPGAVFRARQDNEHVFDHKHEPVGDYVVALGEEIVATGGFLLHYNPPFADLYMEVREDYTRRGYGSFLLQEVKKQCYLAGRVPAARTGIRNIASRNTLIKAGFRVCGYMLKGKSGAGLYPPADL